MLAKKEELEKYLVATLRHSMEVHYYLAALNLHSLNKIHDLEGLNNKFEIDVALRLALGFKNGNAETEFKQEIEIGKELHKKQKHHQILKTSNLDINEYSESLVDAICAAKEERSYHKKRTWDEILKNIESELPEKKLKALVIDLIKRMRRIAEPDVSLITNLRNFPNIGLEEKLYRRFRVRCAEALEVFQKELGLLLF
ncbi:hypothetical protein J4223_00095 [Candidatus Woesearchaeota archaeon]|nr:hypothetical protein [Candidatus Woesearchaeota archaeon]